MHLKNKIERLKSGDGSELMETLESHLLPDRAESEEGEEIEERAPRMAKPEWVVDGKTVKNERAAIAAAAAASIRSGGKPVKIWEKPDPVSGFTGGNGYAVSVKRITRSRRNF